MTILAVLNDLMFQSKIQAAAQAVGRPVRLVRWASLLGLVKYRVLAFGKA